MDIRRFPIILAALLLAACGESEKSRLANPNTAYIPAAGGLEVNSGQPNSNYDPISYWDGDGVQGKPSVKIYLKEQRAYFYKADVLVGESQVSAGREGHNTPVGSYKIIQKDKDHASSLYGDYVDAAGNVVQKDVEAGKDPKPAGAIFKGAPMPFFMRPIVRGIAGKAQAASQTAAPASTSQSGAACPSKRRTADQASPSPISIKALAISTDTRSGMAPRASSSVNPIAMISPAAPARR